MYKNWAMPVTSPFWATIATVLDKAKRISGYRFFVHSAHKTWARAVAPPKGWVYTNLDEQHDSLILGRAA